jgi:hypothetical protein
MSALISSSAQIGDKAECQIQCVQNDVGNVGISQSLCRVGPTDAHTGTLRPPNASLSGPAGLSYHIHHTVRKQFPDDAVIAAVRKWVASAGAGSCSTLAKVHSQW